MANIGGVEAKDKEPGEPSTTQASTESRVDANGGLDQEHVPAETPSSVQTKQGVEDHEDDLGPAVKDEEAPTVPYRPPSPANPEDLPTPCEEGASQHIWYTDEPQLPGRWRGLG